MSEILVDNTINSMIDSIVLHCIDWIGKDENGNDVIIDPIDNKVIGAHYALSHFSVAMCIYGYKEKNSVYENIGLKILRGMLNRWESDSKSYDFHNDFNNFALCILANFWEENNIYLHDELYQRIVKCVLSSPDSRHDTINWIPMRIFVNKKRAQWSSNNSFNNKVKKLKKIVRSAINQDGLIEDRLPKGVSFNLQYNVSTLSLLAFNNKYGEDFEIDLPVNALIKLVDPTGDINFLGRGCNQIFCWGPWIYLLKLTNQDTHYHQAIDFLEKRISKMIENNNIFLNEYSGHDKFLWWDYHYASVYISHLLFWLIMTKYENKRINVNDNYQENKNDSGLVLYKTQDFYAVIFEGRKEYLSEKGPVLANIWFEKYGHIFKGSFGPWQGMFGNKYSMPLNTLFNYLGPIQGVQKKHSFKVNHVFPEIHVHEMENEIKVFFEFQNNNNRFFNLPIFASSSITNSNIKVYAEDEEVKMVSSATFRNQYDELILYQSTMMKSRKWTLIIQK